MKLDIDKTNCISIVTPRPESQYKRKKGVKMEMGKSVPICNTQHCKADVVRLTVGSTPVIKYTDQRLYNC